MKVTVTFPLPEGKKEEKVFYFACPIPLSRIEGLDKDEIKNCPAKTIDQLFLHDQKRPHKKFAGTIQSFFEKLSETCTVSANCLGITLDTRISAKAVVRSRLKPFLRKKPKNHQTKLKTIKRHSSRTVNWVRA